MNNLLIYLKYFFRKLPLSTSNLLSHIIECRNDSATLYYRIFTFEGFHLQFPLNESTKLNFLKFNPYAIKYINYPIMFEIEYAIQHGMRHLSKNTLPDSTPEQLSYLKLKYDLDITEK